MLRDKTIDNIRGVAILIVILGHALQVCHGGATTDPLHRVILAFQMPLLFAISGYTAALSKSYPLKNDLARKAKRLLIPHLSWLSLFYLIILLVTQFTTIPPQPNFFIAIFTGGTWFLRQLFVIFAIFLCARQLTFYKHRLIAGTLALISLIIFSLIPGNESIILHATAFLIGYCFNQRKRAISIKVQLAAMTVFVALIPIHLLYYKTYWTSTLVALFGSTTVCSLAIWAMKRDNNLSIVNWCGQNSLGLYVIHTQIIFYPFSTRFIDSIAMFPQTGFNYYACAGIVFLSATIASALFLKIARRTKLIRALFLGES